MNTEGNQEGIVKYAGTAVLAGLAILGVMSCAPLAPHGAGAERLAGPSSGFVDSTYQFLAHIVATRTWKSGHFAWGDGGGQFVPVVSTDTVLTDTHTWRSPGRYRVMAQMQDQSNILSDWSDSIFVNVDTAPH